MKIYVTFLLIFICTVSFSQTIRNSILGIYSGTYWDYGNSQPIVAAGVKITPHPTDTSGFILTDTINNITADLQISLAFGGFPEEVVDTFIWNYYQICGDIMQDSINYRHFSPPEASNGTALFKLKCVQHTFPTAIKKTATIFLTIYPNPTNNKLYFKSDKKITNYIIYNAVGQQIKNTDIKQTMLNYIDVTELPNGIFYIKFQTLNGEVIKRFIKN